jgi:hypothetical protein
MKEDYLWDKTGEDDSIARLENALQAFRYEETAPPALPANVFTVEKEKPRRFFQIGFAFAAFASVFLVLSFFWFQTAGDKIPPVETFAENNQPEIVDRAANEEFNKTTDKSAPAVKIENSTPPAKPKAAATRQTIAPVVRANKAVLRNKPAKAPSETLTAEEKYAYDQLMLALSITGSKLQIVKDKINGIEERHAVLDTTK